MVGCEFVLQQTPRNVTAAVPSFVTLLPQLAEVWVTALITFVVTVGACPASVLFVVFFLQPGSIGNVAEAIKINTALDKKIFIICCLNGFLQSNYSITSSNE